MNRLILVMMLALSLPVAAHAQGVTRKDTAKTFTATAGSDVNGFACATTKCRFDIGPGDWDFFWSDGARPHAALELVVDGPFYPNGVIAQWGAGPITLKGNESDGATAIAVKVGNANALGTSGAKVIAFYSDDLSTEVASIDKNGRLRIGSVTGPVILSGAGVPAADTTYPVGSLYLRTDGGATTTLYVKTAASTWTAK